MSKNLELFIEIGPNAEAVEHKSLPWVGIMWHPEREDKISQLFKNLVSNTFF